MAHLQLNNVTKIYDKNTYAVRAVSFSVQDKGFVVLVGPSGCGKTTILRLIAGLDDVTDGEILIDNTCVNNMPPKDRDIAMVFQNYALYPHMTVFDNMAFGLKMRKYPAQKIRDHVREAADILGIDDLLDRLPRQLSGGQRQRVAVGRAIVRQPRLFLFDEPLSNLDAKLRVQMRAELARLHKRFQATIIYVTHDQVEAMTLGEKIVVLSAGTVQQIADPTVLYKHPRNKFIAGFIGTPPMNFLKGIISETGKKTCFRHPDIELNLNRKFRNYLNQEVIIGIRPTDFSLNRGSPVELTVDVIEPMGSELYIYGRRNSTMLTARLAEHHRPNPGENITLRIDPDRLYLFDADNEETLL
jgi:multiple sugar transport system ATP-binding protein